MINTEVGDFAGMYAAIGNISCSIAYINGTNIIMPIEGIERDGGNLVINTECGQFGARFCDADHACVLQFYNQYDMEIFENQCRLPGHDGQLFEISVCFYGILDNFCLFLKSKGFEFRKTFKQFMVKELYSLALYFKNIRNLYFYK